MTDKSSGISTLLSLLGGAAAITSAVFACTSSNQAVLSNSINAIGTRAEGCFTVGQHYYGLVPAGAPSTHPNNLAGEANFNKARNLLNCAKSKSGDEIAACIRDEDAKQSKLVSC